MRFFYIAIVLAGFLFGVGCPQRVSRVTIAGKSIIDGKFYDATFIWDRSSDRIQILVDRRFETGFVGQYDFNVKMSEFTAELVELEMGHRSFFYRAQIGIPRKQIRVNIHDAPEGNREGWPCSHAKDNLLIDIDYQEELTEELRSNMRFSADYLVGRNDNPFNALRYQIHPCW